MGKSVSIVIPHLILDDQIYDLAKSCLKSIKEYTSNYELINIDNASPERNEWLRMNSDIYVHNKKNVGNGPGWNQGIKLATGDYIAFCDNDIYVDEGWLEKLIEILEDKKVGIAFPMTKCKEEPDYNSKLSGFCWVTRRDIINEIGLIDEKFGIANFEDVDYFKRVQNAGYKLKCDARVRVAHYSRATCDKVQEVKDIFDNNEKYFLQKHNSVYPHLDI